MCRSKSFCLTLFRTYVAGRRLEGSKISSRPGDRCGDADLAARRRIECHGDEGAQCVKRVLRALLIPPTSWSPVTSR